MKIASKHAPEHETIGVHDCRLGLLDANEETRARRVANLGTLEKAHFWPIDNQAGNSENAPRTVDRADTLADDAEGRAALVAASERCQGGNLNIYEARTGSQSVGTGTGKRSSS